MYAFLRILVKIYYYIVYNIKVYGKENIPKQKSGFIIASNHVSFNDPPLLGIIFKGKYTFMAKEELFQKNPIFAWLIRRLGAFPVHRGAKDNSAIEKAIESLKHGRIFIIFPEGTRSKDGNLGKAKSGVTIIAGMAKVPVVPVYIQYGRKKFRRHITVSVGKEIPAEKFSVDLTRKTEIKAISASIMSEIAALKESTHNAD